MTLSILFHVLCHVHALARVLAAKWRHLACDVCIRAPVFEVLDDLGKAHRSSTPFRALDLLRISNFVASSIHFERPVSIRKRHPTSATRAVGMLTIGVAPLNVIGQASIAIAVLPVFAPACAPVGRRLVAYVAD